MSKAFTSETDDDETFFQPPPLPPGVRNYVTPQGYAELKSAYDRLSAERASLVPGDWKSDRRLKAINSRLEFLTGRLDAAQVVETPSGGVPERVRFGTTATVASEDGTSQSWTIVGIDEMDLDQGKVSWQSPLASALLDKAVGEVVAIGRQTVRITAIH